jgi:protein O-GlcNAc transferase
MSDRLAASQAALQGGRRNEAIEHLIAAVQEDPARTVQVYRTLVIQLYGAGRFAEGEAFAAKGLVQHPRDFDLLNSRGVLLRKLRRYPEALETLEQAQKVNPSSPAAANNRGNVLLDLGEGARAEAIFQKLVRQDPKNSELQRQLGRALVKQGKLEPGFVRLRQAVTLKKDNVDAWLDMAGAYNDEQDLQKAEEVLDKALAANPGHPRLLEGKVTLMRRGGRLRAAEAFLLEMLPAQPNAAWLHHQIGGIICDWDRERANAHFRKAVALEPSLEHQISLVESLERTRTGDEGGNIEEAYQLARTLMGRKAEFSDATNKILSEVFIRVCAFDATDALGSFKAVGRGWAESRRHTALLKQLARVRSDEDRLELVEQHRIWGRLTEATAAKAPVKRKPRVRGDKIRLGFMSSDLRQHPVGYFALPLFDHVDRERFEVFVYSYYQGQEDAAQAYITRQVSAYRWWPDVGVAEAAQRIADDQLDVLIELGGSTHMNKLEVMAYKPAPIQASWLGYPHSAGLSTIDYFVCDPYSRPTRPEYLIETPLMMPHTWLALGKAIFSDRHEATTELPESRNGFLTFGTANNPHKYSRQVLRTWAKVVAAVPNARFAFVRPEGSSATFRENIVAEFEAESVAADRVIFHTVRGRHMPFYNELDITLDPFPLTGGTTTAESLWMGVPLISLVGEPFHERLSSNAGLGDLCARSLDEYQALALQLAADRGRRQALRLGLRDQIKASPLGQTEAFAKDFYDMVARAVAEHPV